MFSEGILSELQVSTSRLSIYVVQIITTNLLPISLFSFIDSVQLWMKMEQMKKNGNGKSSKSPRIGLQNYRRWDLSSPALSIVDGTCWPTHLHRPLLERYSHSDDIWLFLRFCFVNTVCEYIIFRVRLAVIFKSVSTLKNTFKCF